jgi:hypothetical protein
VGNVQPLELTVPDTPIAQSGHVAGGEISIGCPARGTSAKTPSSPASS